MKITTGQKQSAKYALAFVLGISVAGSTTTATESPAQSTEPSPSTTEPEPSPSTTAEPTEPETSIEWCEEIPQDFVSVTVYGAASDSLATHGGYWVDSAGEWVAWATAEDSAPALWHCEPTNLHSEWADTFEDQSR